MRITANLEQIRCTQHPRKVYSMPFFFEMLQYYSGLGQSVRRKFFCGYKPSVAEPRKHPVEDVMVEYSKYDVLISISIALKE